jgi:hypothetical protein
MFLCLQSSDKYFLESSDKVSYFFEAGAVDENGKLMVESKIALNKVGHALHWLNPTFKKHTFSEKVKETCFQLGLVEPVVIQSMYIFKNPGVGSEGTDQYPHSHFQNHWLANLLCIWQVVSLYLGFN